MFDINNINPTGMHHEIVIVTPEMAKKWLETNDRNRPLNKREIKQIEYDLINGNYELTHQSAAIDKNGILFDGQHRMTAIVNTGIPAPMVIAFNAPRNTKVDSGVKRTSQHALYMAGEIERTDIEFNSLTFPLVTFMVAQATNNERATTLTTDNKHYIYKRYKKFIDPIINIARRANGKCRSAALLYSMLCALIAGVDLQTISEWHKVVETGEYYFKGDDQKTLAAGSVLLFRRFILQNSAASATRDTKEYQDTVIKKAMSSISHYANKHAVKKLYGELVYEKIAVTEDDMKNIKEAV